jgi:hypothetical protein
MVVRIVAALILFAVTASGWIAGLGPYATFLGLFGAIVLYRELWRDEAFERDQFPSHAPMLLLRDRPSLDVSDELADLLRLAKQRVNTGLATQGRFDPFVIYDDRNGSSRMRLVAMGGNPDMVLARARETARAVPSEATRVVLAIMSGAVIDRKRTPVVYYEAAERWHLARTHAFVQRYHRKHLLVPGGVVGLPIYVGEAPHTLRFSASPALGEA